MASEQMPRRENTNKVVEREAHVETHRKAPIVNKGRGEKNEKERELVSDRVRSGNIAQDKEVEERRRGREGGGAGVQHVRKFETRDEEKKGLGEKAKLEERTRVVVGRDWNKEEKLRSNRPTGTVEAEKGRPLEETREETKGRDKVETKESGAEEGRKERETGGVVHHVGKFETKGEAKKGSVEKEVERRTREVEGRERNKEEKQRSSPEGKVEAQKARPEEAKAREKAETKQGGCEEQGRGREENEQLSLEEFSKYRAEAQQNSFDAIEAAKERYERVKQQASEAAKERHQQANEEATKERYERARQQASAAVSERNKHANEEAAKERQERAKQEANEAAKERNKQANEEESKDRHGRAKQEANEAAKDRNKQANEATMAKDFNREKGQQDNLTEQEETEEKGYGESQDTIVNVDHTTPSALAFTTAQYLGDKASQAGKSVSKVAADLKDQAIVTGWNAAHYSSEMTEMSVEGAKAATNVVKGAAEYAGQKASQLASKSVDTAKGLAAAAGEGGREVLGAVGETVVEIGENMAKPAQKVQHQGEEGGVLNAIGETIAEIAETTKVIVAGQGEKTTKVAAAAAGDGENEIIRSEEYAQEDLKLKVN